MVFNKMKLITIFALFELTLLVECTWWAVAETFYSWLKTAAARPVILCLGAFFTALNSDVLDELQPIEWKNWLALKNN